MKANSDNHQFEQNGARRNRRMRYERTISPEEAALGKILILKPYWNRLPAPGSRVNIVMGGEAMRARIQRVRCKCVGPERPHYHYYFVLPKRVSLKSWQRVKMHITEN
jgi:hypothetical protein